MLMGPQTISASGEDIDVLARTIWGEARGESLAGQIAVGWTVRHRALIASRYLLAHGRWHPHYGDGSIGQACKARMQYSCWNADDPNQLKLKNVTLDDPSFQQCMRVALGVVHGALADALLETTHYFNPAAGLRTPDWITGLPARGGRPAIPPARKVGSMGAHDFYADVPA